MRLRPVFGALTVGLTMAGVVALTAPAASAAPPPQQKLLKLVDSCDKPSWDADPVFAGFCLVDAGGVTPARFTADLAKGGNNNWWINNRQETIKAGDSLSVDNVGGGDHTFTQVEQFGGGIAPPFNAAIAETTLAVPTHPVPDPPGAPLVGTAAATAVAPDAAHPGVFNAPASRTVTGLTPGTYKFQCLIHPWMRTVVTVRPAA